MRLTLFRDLYHGEHVLDALKTLAGKRAFIVVGDGPMKCLGFLDKVVDCLKEAGMEVQPFKGVKSDSSVETVMKGAKTMGEFNPDWIVATGGGSPIDAAGAMWAFYEYPDTSSEGLIVPFNPPTLRTKAKLCAVPSISGTTTEVIVFSVITDYDKGIKYPLVGFNITSDVAIVDPALTETMPKKPTVHTGMNAMTHATEAYMSTLSCEYTDLLVLYTTGMINEYLIPSCNGDVGTRDKMRNAQCLAEMASSNALLGIIHSMAHKTGTAYSGGHTVHDCANAMYLPKVVKYNSKEPGAVVRCVKIVKSINLPSTANQELTDTFIARIREVNKGLDIPICIRDYEGDVVDEKEFMERLPAVAELAAGDTCTGSSPRFITPAQMEGLLTCCSYDGEVTF